MRLESLLGRLGLGKHSEVKRPPKPETLTAATLEEFVDLVRRESIGDVKGFVDRKIIPHTGVRDTLLAKATGYYSYDGVLTAQGDDKVIAYKEKYGDEYGSSTDTGFINRERREQMAVQTLITTLHRLRHVESLIPGVETHLIDLSTDAPFTEQQLGNLEQDRQRLGIRPIPIPAI